MELANGFSLRIHGFPVGVSTHSWATHLPSHAHRIGSKAATNPLGGTTTSSDSLSTCVRIRLAIGNQANQAAVSKLEAHVYSQTLGGPNRLSSFAQMLWSLPLPPLNVRPSVLAAKVCISPRQWAQQV